MKKESAENYQSLFIENVKWLRSKYSLTEREMSKILGVSVMTLRRIENGEFPERLSITVIFRIQKYFNVEAKRVVGERLI